MSTELIDTGVPNTTIHEHIRYDRSNYLTDEESVQTYRDYVAGKHSQRLTEEQLTILEGLTSNKFCENLARKIIAEARDRLRFSGWSCPNDAVNEWLESHYTYNRIRNRQSKIHFDALRDGDHGIAINWDNSKQRVRVYREPWWDGREGLFIAYSRVDEAVYAVKEWVLNKSEGGNIIRRTVYFSDRFERYVSTDGGNNWLPIVLDTDEGLWPVPWLKTDGTPLGIPYVHFRNAGQGQDVYGSSELAGGVIGLIDQIQDLHYVLSGAARMTGFQILTIAGIKLELAAGSTTEYKKPRAAPGTILYSTDPNTKFGRIEPGDPKGIIDTRMVKMQALAVTTQTPIHIITGGDWPSGEALIRAEQPAVGKATTQIDALEASWSEVAHRSIEVHNRFSSEAPLEESMDTAMVSAIFDSPERRDPLSNSIIVNNLGDRISDREALRRMGYTEAEAEKIEEEKREESRENAETQALLFSRGVGRGTELPGRGEEPEGA